MDRARARQGLALYFGLVILGSGTLEGALIATREPITKHLALVLANMWVPGVASIVARLVLRDGFGDVSFRLRRNGVRELALGWFYAVPVGLVGYGLAWKTGLARYAVPASLSATYGGFAFPVSLAMALTVGTAFSALAAAGEELGWRGYMVTRLVDAGVPRPVLVSGAIWAFWHVPLIVTGQYASGPSPALSAVLFATGTIAAGAVAARVRLASGSVWPAVLFHAAWNSVIQGTFDGFTRGGDAARTDNVWIGESGIFVVVASVILAILVTARPFPYRQTPASDASARISAHARGAVRE